MAARRQSSTTSLSKYVRAADEAEAAPRSLDFCNAFWGASDAGVEVLFARMRGAARTMEELRAFWKERAAIEEDYAKRLSALSKKPLGRDEIGELHNSLDTLRVETANHGATHHDLMSTIRRTLEGQVAEFVSRQSAHKKTFQAHVEKIFRNKQAQEASLEKAREKYEQDCIRINSYTAQSTLVQGRDLDKLQLKLERVKQTVHGNLTEYRNNQRALHDVCLKWEKEWRTFCDQCQDLEEDRIETMKNNMWNYANAVSTACVADDESCEKMRIALEQIDAPVEQETFVQEYGTGAEIWGATPFVNYKEPDAAQKAQPEVRYANYARSSNRPPPMTSYSLPDEDTTVVNQAGIGAGGGQIAQQGQEQRSRSRASSRARLDSAPPSADSMRGASVLIPPIPGQQQQQQQPPAQTPSPAVAPQLPPIASLATAAGGVGDAADPLTLTLENLRSGGSSNNANNNGRRSSAVSPAPQQQQQQPPVQQQQQQQQQLQQQPHQNVRSPSRTSRRGSSGLGIDYAAVADAIIGPHPSRPTTPSGAPTAKFMQPPTMSTSPVAIEEVVSAYQQSFPGEHAHRRALSRQNSMSRQSMAGADVEARGRPVSREGHAGIGANGRAGSLSPAPPQGGSRMSMHRSPSPIQPLPPQQQNQQLHHQARQPSYASQRAASPMHAQNSGARPLGIAFDADGRVTEDAMAIRYSGVPPSQYRQSTSPYPSQFPPQQAQPSGIVATAPPAAYQPATSPAPAGYSSAPPGTSYGQPVYAAQQVRGPPTQPPPMGFPPPTPTPAQYYQQQYQQQQAAQQAAQQQRPSSAYAQSNGWQSPHHQQPSAYQQQHVAPANTFATPSFQQLPVSSTPVPVGAQGQRAPSPQPVAPAGAPPPPTGQYVDDGKGVLFYVKALYDYKATIEEEFDFQAGDVIAVTATPEDGWWSGWLLDDKRRIPGRHVFPSNFVCLF